MFRSTASVTKLSLVVAVAFVAACDNPIEPEDHPEAAGVVILDAGTGAVLATSIGANNAFDVALDLTASEALEIEVKFLDLADPTDLDLAFFPDEDEGESLRVVITDEAVVEYHDHGDHGDLEAVAAGQTTIVFQLYHGSHADFESGDLTVNVE